jgi:ABC-type lipoprotein release transport system permease subunit
MDGEETDLAVMARRRRRLRATRFIAFEAIAIAVLVLSVVAGISERFAAESLTPIFRMLPVIAAGVAALLPILFFGSPKR